MLDKAHNQYSAYPPKYMYILLMKTPPTIKLTTSTSTQAFKCNDSDVNAVTGRPSLDDSK